MGKIFRNAILTKLSDDKFNGDHPNGINKGYSRLGYAWEDPTIGESFTIGTLWTSRVTEILTEKNTDNTHEVIFTTENSTYQLLVYTGGEDSLIGEMFIEICVQESDVSNKDYTMDLPYLGLEYYEKVLAILNLKGHVIKTYDKKATVFKIETEEKFYELIVDHQEGLTLFKVITK